MIGEKKCIEYHCNTIAHIYYHCINLSSLHIFIIVESSEEEDTTGVKKEPRPGGVDKGKVGRLNEKSQLQPLGVHADDDI